MHEPCGGVGSGSLVGAVSGSDEADQRRREAQPAREQPHGIEAVVAEHELSEDRAEREAAPEPRLKRLSASPRRCSGARSVIDRRRTDEQQRLSGPVSSRRTTSSASESATT
jgi:hypothetical protein